MKKLLRCSLLGLLLLCSVVVNGAQVPKYIFLFIGDGMGFNHVEATQIYAEKVGTDTGECSLLFPTFPVMTQVCTRSASHLITCSSAAATALATGEKTTNYVIGMDAEKNHGLKSLARQLKDKGYKIGIITSASIDHATPGGFYASQPDRSMYYEIGVDAANSGFDFFGGAGLLEPRSKRNLSAPCLYDLFNQKGYTMFRGMDAYNRAAAKDKILLFPTDTVSKSLKYAMDRSAKDLSLPDLTKACLANFQETAKKGFFMMVEGGKIDWACHANDAGSTINDTIALADAVEEAVAFAKKHPDDTLILVTGDHETGGLTIGYAGTDYDTYLTNLSNQKISYAKFDSDYVSKYKENQTPFETMMQDVEKLFGLKLKGSADDKLVLTDYEVGLLKTAYEKTLSGKKADSDNQKEYVLYGSYEPLSVTITHLLNNKSGINFSSYAHTGLPVAVFAKGAGQEKFGGFYDNTQVYHKLADLMGIDK